MRLLYQACSLACVRVLPLTAAIRATYDFVRLDCESLALRESCTRIPRSQLAWRGANTLCVGHATLCASRVSSDATPTARHPIELLPLGEQPPPSVSHNMGCPAPSHRFSARGDLAQPARAPALHTWQGGACVWPRPPRRCARRSSSSSTTSCWARAPRHNAAASFWGSLPAQCPRGGSGLPMGAHPDASAHALLR